MSENISSQTWPIRVSSISNFLLGGFVAGCLVICIAYLVESGKRTVIEEQFFTEVKELPAHEVEEIIKNAILKRISESKKVENELLSDQKVAGVSNPEYGVESCVAPMELTAGGLSIVSPSDLKAMARQIVCPQCEELIAELEALARDISAKLNG